MPRAKSDITETPKIDLVTKKSRVAKEKDRRDKENAALKELRHTIELADPKAFYRHEKVDTIEDAVYTIERLAGGFNEPPQRAPIVFDEEMRSADQGKTLTRVQVEKLRRAREAKAMKRLKETLKLHSKEHQSRIIKVDAITSAAALIRSLAVPTQAPARLLPGPGSSATPGTSPTTSVDSGFWSPTSTSPGLSPELLLASLIQQQISTLLPNRIPLGLGTQFLPAVNNLCSITTVAQLSRHFWRPWE